MTATAFTRRLARTCALLAAAASAGAADETGIEFFEKKIRPVLIERCHECHAADKKVKAGLRLDHAEGWLRGGDSGPAVVPGKPDESPLIKAIRYTKLEFEAMPPDSNSKQIWTHRSESLFLDTFGRPDPNQDPISSSEKSTGTVRYL